MIGVKELFNKNFSQKIKQIINKIKEQEIKREFDKSKIKKKPLI